MISRVRKTPSRTASRAPAIGGPPPSATAIPPTVARVGAQEPDYLAAEHQDLALEGRRERRRRETFERMVRAAREILFNRDFDDVRVTDITDAADVGKG